MKGATVSSRRVLVLITTVVVAALAAPAVAAVPKQVEKGVIVAPTPLATCHYLTYLNAVLDTAARLNGVVLYDFPIDPATRGHAFTLTLPTKLSADLDITFYTARGLRSYDKHALGGESGTVPRTAKSAVICLAVGAPAPFTYRAY